MSEKDFERSSEELSALLDGETSELELRRLLKSVEADQALCQKWSRYQLASAVLQGQTKGQAAQWQQIDISARVAQAVAAEPELGGFESESTEQSVASAKKRRARSGLIKPFANVAVAASVSAAVIVGWQSLQQSPASGPGLPTQSATLASSAAAPAVATPAASAPAAARAFASSPAPSFARQGNSPWMAVSEGGFGGSMNQLPAQDVIRYNPEVSDRLNYYFLSHSGNAAGNTASQVAPYGRVVNIPLSQEESASTSTER